MQYFIKPLAVSLVTIGLICGQAVASEKIVIKSGDVHGDGYPTVEAIKYMGGLLSDWTDGRISIKVFGGGVLGAEKEMVEQVQIGALEMARVSVGVAGPIVDEFNAFNLPFVFRSADHMYKVTEGEIGTELLEGLDKGGLVGLGYMDGGSRSFYNNERAITKIEDLAGLKIRVMGNPIFVDMVNAMGGNGIQIPFTEVYTSIQTGVVDGAENNPPTLIEHQHWKVAKHYTLTEHLMVPEIFVFSKRVFDKLSDEDQALIRKASRLAVLKQRELWKAKVGVAVEKMQAAGYAIITDIDKTPFIEATQDVRNKYGAKWKSLMDKVAAVK
ncbi:MAG: TRAP transporter substrate-binding protein [Pseudomonadales bacterium]|nr:TRAP transporter substrate-binding protein [Pseudomonadales bacterium]NRA14565.1 TRAP transporter substrate-binding protein [Oceanospirillaceae bacterium]